MTAIRTSPHNLALTCLLCLGLPSVIIWLIEATIHQADGGVTKAASASIETDMQYGEGQTAAANGIPCEACPYLPSHYDPDYTLLRESWLKGWISKTIELKGQKQ